MIDTKVLDETTDAVNIYVGRNLVIGQVYKIKFADVAELADAQASGACGLRPVEVRLLSSAFILPCRPEIALLSDI